jgi:hypothetical protein
MSDANPFKTHSDVNIVVSPLAEGTDVAWGVHIDDFHVEGDVGFRRLQVFCASWLVALVKRQCTHHITSHL